MTKSRHRVLLWHQDSSPAQRPLNGAGHGAHIYSYRCRSHEIICVILFLLDQSWIIFHWIIHAFPYRVRGRRRSIGLPCTIFLESFPSSGHRQPVLLIRTWKFLINVCFICCRCVYLVDILKAASLRFPRFIFQLPEMPAVPLMTLARNVHEIMQLLLGGYPLGHLLHLMRLFIIYESIQTVMHTHLRWCNRHSSHSV